MRRPIRNAGVVGGVIAATVAAAGAACEREGPPRPRSNHPHLSDVTIEPAPGTVKPPFAFTPEDDLFLDEVARSAFDFLWKVNDPRTGMVPDRLTKPTVSVAGVGFQLSGICIGVERGWITRAQGEERATLILRSLSGTPENRKAGMFYHFVDAATAGQPVDAYEHVVSTVDSALLFSGILTASQYFGGEVATMGDALFGAADWTFFVAGEEADPFDQGFITLGWKPTDKAAPTGEGALLPFYWIDNGDEHRLVTFLAACAPVDAHRVDPITYYRMRRQIGNYGDSGPMVWFPWSGALFTSFFAHCWIDYSAMGTDNPAAFEVANRPRVDWWENSRRHVGMHRQKAIENPQKLPGFGENAWGLTASDVATGYAVPGLFPDPLPAPGSIPRLDVAVSGPTDGKDQWGDGTLAPYGAGSAVMFEPAAAVAALRHYRSLTRSDGSSLAWSDPSSGGYGFRDAFNVGTGWAAEEYLAIDQGPLLLAIENARTGLIWRLFHEHPVVKAGMARLKLTRTR